MIGSANCSPILAWPCGIMVAVFDFSSQFVVVLSICVLALWNCRIKLINLFAASENELKLASKTLKTREVVDGKGRNVEI